MKFYKTDNLIIKLISFFLIGACLLVIYGTIKRYNELDLLSLKLNILTILFFAFIIYIFNKEPKARSKKKSINIDKHFILKVIGTVFILIGIIELQNKTPQGFLGVIFGIIIFFIDYKIKK